MFTISSSLIPDLCPVFQGTVPWLTPLLHFHSCPVAPYPSVLSAYIFTWDRVPTTSSWLISYQYVTSNRKMTTLQPVLAILAIYSPTVLCCLMKFNVNSSLPNSIRVQPFPITILLPGSLNQIYLLNAYQLFITHPFPHALYSFLFSALSLFLFSPPTPRSPF